MRLTIALGIAPAYLYSEIVRLRVTDSEITPNTGKNMKISKLLIVTVLCVGLGSAADAKQKGHRRNGKHHAKHHQAKKTTPVPPAVVPPTPMPPTPASGHHTI